MIHTGQETEGSSRAEGLMGQRVELNHPEQSAGAAMPSHGDSTAKPRRSFTSFEQERATYERHKHELLKTAQGKFVVIVGDELVGPLENDEQAEREGYARFGLGPLYIKQIQSEEPPALVTRDVVPCRT